MDTVVQKEMIPLVLPVAAALKAMGTPGAPPPVLRFLRGVVGWTILVWGCALPLMIATWPRAEPGGRAGEICGVAAWTIAVVARDERLRWRGFPGASRPLRSGAAVLLVVQALAATVLPSLFIFLAYSPAVWLVAKLPLIADDASMFYGDFVLTVACGGQAFGCALALGHLVEKLRPSMSTR